MYVSSSTNTGTNSGQQYRYYSGYTEGNVILNIKKGPPWKVLFFGTDEFSLPHLDALNMNRYVI